MIIRDNVSLAPYTSLRVGGPAEHLALPATYDEAIAVLSDPIKPWWFLGYGSNTLVSDNGLAGTTLMWRNGAVNINGDVLIADAGAWWDDAVHAAIENGLWGLELMSEIPSSVGAAVYGNIAAYGQQISDTLAWIDVYDTSTQSVMRLPRDEIVFSYRHSSLQDAEHRYILRAAFQLSRTRLHELRYDSAIAIAQELGLDHSTLSHCRDIIIETRRRAGSLYDPADDTALHTAGSFFKNPLVTSEQATLLASFDETGKTLERILNQSTVHGGSAQRASAAHVLLAAGFHRGQRWGNVELHPSHILKLSTLTGATAQDVYDVATEIIATVKHTLNIELEPEVTFLGNFSR